MARKATVVDDESITSTQEGSVLESIKEALREQIVSGHLPEGATVPSEHELATQYGLNRNHTRLVLRDLAIEGYILRTRGRRSVVAPGATEKNQAQTLYGRKTIALLRSEPVTQFCQDVASGFMLQASLEGLQTVAYNLRFEDDSESHFLKHVRELGLKGLALWIQHDTEETRGLLSSFIDEGFPFVLLDRYIPSLATDYVVTDNEALAYHLTRKLLERGHRRIGFVSDTFQYSSTRDRRAGHVRALKDAGLELAEKYLVDADFGPEAKGFTLDQVMAHREAPTGLFCIHDTAARAVAADLRRLGYRIPEDVEIATVDDEHFSARLGIPMITARQPLYEIGRQAAEVLAARLREPKRPVEHRVLPPIFADDSVAEGAALCVEGAAN